MTKAIALNARRAKPIALAELLCDLLEDREDEVPVLLELEARPRVTGRRRALRLVVENLIDNAVRASPPGGLVQVRLNAQGNSAFIEIVDQGSGPPRENRRHLFDPFFYGEGLGLAASHVIAKAHGGRLELQTSPTTFRLTLPVT